MDDNVWRVAILREPDLDLAAGLHAQAFAGGEAGQIWSRQELAGLLASPGVFGLLLFHGTTACGLLVARQVEDEAELLTIGVAPPARRMGAATHLLRLSVTTARGRGAHRLFLEVAEDNTAARALYRKHRFHEVGRRKAYYSRIGGVAVDAIILRLDIETIAANSE